MIALSYILGQYPVEYIIILLNIIHYDITIHDKYICTHTQSHTHTYIDTHTQNHTQGTHIHPSHSCTHTHTNTHLQTHRTPAPPPDRQEARPYGRLIWYLSERWGRSYSSICCCLKSPQPIRRQRSSERGGGLFLP